MAGAPAGRSAAGRSRTGTAGSTSRRPATTRPREGNPPQPHEVTTGGAGGQVLPPPRPSSTLETSGNRGTSRMTTILVVEDEMKIARLVRDYLVDAGFEVIVAGDGGAAVSAAHGQKPDLIVLDLGLPGRDGLDVTRDLRRTSDVPIVMLTATTEESDKIVGLELGADDYLTKPFSGKELVARVRAVLRRSQASEHSDLVRVGGLEIEVNRMRVSLDGRAVELTATEFQLLLAMARQPGRVF